MKKIKRITIFTGIILLLFIANILISTGFFRTVDNQFNGTIFKEVPIKGAEDITLSVLDSFALVSATSRIKYPPTKEEFGELYFVDLKNTDFKTTLLTANFPTSFAPHGISMIKTDSTYTVMAVNHTPKGSTIEVFTLLGDSLVHKKTLTDSAMISPNDIVLLDKNRFYFTNDHRYTEGIGLFFEEYGGRSISNVVYFDGENYTEVADGIAYANGINFDAKRNLLFVASPRGFLINVYSKNDDGSLDFIEDIPCGFGVDNIEIDTQGNLWIGGHPNLLHFKSYAQGKKETSPSEIIKITYKRKGDYTIESIYTGDGSNMSGATVAAPFGDYIFTGNVMDSHFLILKRN